MELGETNAVAALSLFVAYAMVALGVGKKRLFVRQRRCPSCRADVRSCRCRP